MEMQKAEFHEKVAQGYRVLAKEHPDRIVRLDAALSVDEISAQIRQHVERLLS